jgi:ABC-type amino acid transport substrate-binding protein
MTTRWRAAVGLIVAVTVWRSVPGLAAAGDLPQIGRRGALRVLYAPGEPEFIAVGSRSASGFDHDVLGGFAKAHGVKLEAVLLPTWDGLIPALIEDRGDLIAGGFTVTDARRKLVDFTVEVFPTRFVAVTRKPHRGVQNLEELRRERVGTHKGTVLVDVLREAGVPAAATDDGVPFGELPRALKAGRVTAAVLELHTALVAQRDDPDLQLGLRLGTPASLAYAVRKGDGQLLEALNRHIESSRRSTTWLQLIVRHFGSAAPALLDEVRKEAGR